MYSLMIGLAPMMLHPVHYTGSHHDVLMSVTAHHNVYRSHDYGLTFKDQADKLRAGFVLNPTIYRFLSDNTIVSLMCVCCVYVWRIVNNNDIFQTNTLFVRS